MNNQFILEMLLWHYVHGENARKTAAKFDISPEDVINCVMNKAILYAVSVKDARKKLKESIREAKEAQAIFERIIA